MAAMRELEWIGMLEDPAGVLHMKYQTCYALAIGSSKVFINNVKLNASHYSLLID